MTNGDPSTSALERAIKHSIDYLASSAAPDALAEDAYWSKWDAP